MECRLLAIFSLVLQTSAAAGPPSEPALAKKIEGLQQIVLSPGTGNRGDAARAEIRQIFKARGLPTVAEVGDNAAYDFVLLASLGQPLEFQRQVLPAIRNAGKHKTVPPDAIVFYQARYRLEQEKNRAKRSAPSHPDLRDEIKRLYKVDQAVRQRAGFDAKKMTRVDRENATPLQAIFKKYGVPTYEMVGVEAAKDFVIMVQHQAPKFRQQVLPKLKANVEAGQADPDSYALVYDRSQRDQGKKQLYGTQLECKSGEAMHEAPIEDEADVDQRRAELGLMRMALYARLTAEMMPQFCAQAVPNQ